MTILPFTNNSLERDNESQDASNLVDLFNLFPVRLKSEPADASNMLREMERVIMSKHVESWADNSNLLGRIGNVYSTLNTDAAEIVDSMSTGSLDDLGLGTFSPIRNDDYLTRVTKENVPPTDIEVLGETDIQAEMAREARMIIDSSFGLTDENFTLA